MKAIGQDSSLEEISEEDIAQFNAIYRAYYQSINANILKIVRHTDMAEDILQEVFMAFWEHRKGLETSRIANWLFVVSYNKSISRLKAKLKESILVVPGYEDLENTVFNDEEISEEQFQWLLGIIDEAVASLPSRKKEIFHLYRVEGLSFDQISEKLNISVATVKDHLTIANKAIRTYIADKYSISGTFTTVFLLIYFGNQ